MKNAKRILHVAALNAGGIEAFIMSIYREIDKSKLNFDFINYFDENNKQFFEDEAKSYGAMIYKSGTMKNKNVFRRHFKKLIYLYKFIKSNEYDTIHIHASDIISVEEAIIAKFLRVPRIIIHSHNTLIDRNSKYYWLKISSHKLIKNIWEYIATDYFACSNLAGEWMFSKKLNKSGKVKIIHNCIDIDKYKFNKDKRIEIRDKLNLDSKFVIGHVGRMSYQKNHKFLIDVFREICKLNENSMLLLIGSGELESELKNKVVEYGIEDKVIFYGLADNICELMQAMDTFVLPSHFEGLPLVGIEAQASGLRVVVSDSITNELKITDNIEFISLDKTSKEWANEIFRFSNNFTRKDVSKQIKNNNYHSESIAKELEKFYLNIK